MDGTYLTPFITDPFVMSYLGMIAQKPNSNNDVFISQVDGSNVARFTNAGVLVDANFIPSGTGGLDYAYDGVVANDGNLYVVSDNSSGKGNKGLLKFDGNTGAPDAAWPYTPDEEHTELDGVTLGPDGMIYGAPNNVTTIWKINPADGSWTGVGDVVADSSTPYCRAIAINPENMDLYIDGVFTTGILCYHLQPDGTYVQDPAMTIPTVGGASGAHMIVRMFFIQDQNGDGKMDLFAHHELFAPWTGVGAIVIYDPVTKAVIPTPTTWQYPAGTSRCHAFGLVNGFTVDMGNLDVVVTLNDFVGNPALANIQVDVSQGGAVIQTRMVAATGSPMTISFPNLLVGSYDVTVQSVKCLNVTGTAAVTKDQTTVFPASMINGDLNGDGAIGLIDLGILKKNWGQS